MFELMTSNGQAKKIGFTGVGDIIGADTSGQATGPVTTARRLRRKARKSRVR